MVETQRVRERELLEWQRVFVPVLITAIPPGGSDSINRKIGLHCYMRIAAEAVSLITPAGGFIARV
jgi:hypothetical protein